jgi:predicted ATP-dependent endonuclease of OLD family
MLLVFSFKLTDHKFKQGGISMPTTITKIKLVNYKRFRDYTIKPNNQINIMVGDNEVGKSTILEAIDIVASGNVRRVEAIGIDKFLNIDVVKQFNAGIRNFENLPKLIVELYLDGKFDHTMNGKNNSDNIICDGIRLVCEANIDYLSEITESLIAQVDYFPYDYYSVRFSTFADEGYTSYKKKIRSILINSANMNSEFATNDFIRRMYNQYTEDDIKERAVHKSKYRQLRSGFCTTSLCTLNERIPAEKNYTFGLKTGVAVSLENDLMIFEEDIGIDSKGTGNQVFIKTDFALERSGTNIDVILIEEPENHLSHVNLRKLIQRVSKTQHGQLFITTHNSLISTRLELHNLIIMHQEAEKEPTTLNDLDDETTKYFLKAPVANVIEYALSKKAILVEGPSEYMLFEKFYETVIGHKPENDNVYIMDIRGLSFKRYLEIASLLGSKVVVVTDNDYNIQKNCIDKYLDYDNDENIKVCYEKNEAMNTFEMVLHSDNKDLCNRLFGAIEWISE